MSGVLKPWLSRNLCCQAQEAHGTWEGPGHILHLATPSARGSRLQILYISSIDASGVVCEVSDSRHYVNCFITASAVENWEKQEGCRKLSMHRFGIFAVVKYKFGLNFDTQQKPSSIIIHIDDMIRLGAEGCGHIGTSKSLHEDLAVKKALNVLRQPPIPPGLLRLQSFKPSQSSTAVLDSHENLNMHRHPGWRVGEKFNRHLTPFRGLRASIRRFNSAS
ncbi:hypothetical protein BC829DRAFT_394834 [Chytridium lagenaria]|nr:hypothetical protein BC829DRAFT_394834 [Chytridium lagenaria]